MVKLQQRLDNMRDEDADEIYASGLYPRNDALLLSALRSDYVTVVTHNSTPLSVFGVRIRGILSDTGTPWLLSSSDVMKHRSLFLRLFPTVIKEMLAVKPILENYVHVKNTVSIQWLKWAGFQFGETILCPTTGETFQKFSMEVNHV